VSWPSGFPQCLVCGRPLRGWPPPEGIWGWSPATR